MIEYRAIDGFPGYRVGADGSVWSCWTNIGINQYCGDAWKLMRTTRVGNGYRALTLCANRVHRSFRVHLLVLRAFVGPCPPGMVAAHNNGKPTDNRVENLRWATQAENLADKKKHGTEQYGERIGTHKLSGDQVRKIRERRAAGERGVDLAREFGVCKATITWITKRGTWKHVL